MKMIEAHNLSKKYTLRSSYQKTTVRDVILGAFDSFRQKNEKQKVVWALKNINFELQEGDTLALIGNNGAGKSTLLKILSRIIKPTGGEATLHGRTGSLLEIGTGFHRELSGRENIFLNGAVLGMKRSEIKAKFDEIVEFSEIEEFLETPIKHYSSGMYMRLAFAVAAHLEPEILIVDEVLAVGDLAFQRKCVNKMRDVNKQGRTIVFVSHNMQAVTRVCKRAIWIKDGEIYKDGESESVVNSYLNSQLKTSSEKIWKNLEDAPGNKIARLRRVRICNKKGETVSVFDNATSIFIEITYEVLQDESILIPGFGLFSEEGVCVFTARDQNEDRQKKKLKKGIYTSRAEIPENFLAEGSFYVSIYMSVNKPQNLNFSARDVVAFLITKSLNDGLSQSNFTDRFEGLVKPTLKWESSFEIND